MDVRVSSIEALRYLGILWGTKMNSLFGKSTGAKNIAPVNSAC